MVLNHQRRQLASAVLAASVQPSTTSRASFHANAGRRLAAVWARRLRRRRQQQQHVLAPHILGSWAHQSSFFLSTTTTTTTTAGPIAQAYQNLVASGRVQNDDQQVVVAAQLDHLRESVVRAMTSLSWNVSVQAMTDVTPQGNVTQRLWHVWQQAQWKWQQQEHPAPRGLYLYGSVGVGKSFLMDLFHQSLVVDDVTSPTTAGASMNISCRRAHFHEFMLDVHQRISRSQTSDAPRRCAARRGACLGPRGTGLVL